MRKSILMISAVMMLMACGGQSKKETSDADSTQVFEVPDTLNTVEAVIKQVDAVDWEFKANKQFDISKWYNELVELAEPLFAGNDPVEFYEYALIDVDSDGKAELYMRNADHYEAVFTLDDKDPHVLIDADSRRSISFFKNAVQSSGSCGTGCNAIEIVVLKDSKLAYTLNNMEQYDMEGNLSENNWSKDDKDIPTEDGEKMYKDLGDPIDLYIKWHEIDIERKPKLSE